MMYMNRIKIIYIYINPLQSHYNPMIIPRYPHGLWIFAVSPRDVRWFFSKAPMGVLSVTGTLPSGKKVASPSLWRDYHVVIISMAISGSDLLEVPTIYKAYFLGLCKGISPQNMALYGTVPPF